MENTEKLKNYIWQQLQTGLTADEVAGHLAGAGWSPDQIHAAFAQVQANVVPTVTMAPAAGGPQTTSQSTPSSVVGKRGRFKTSWLLFKQSRAVLKGNKYLYHYMWLTVFWGMLIAIVFGVFFYFADNTLFNHPTSTGSDSPKPLGFVIIFIYYVVIYFAINFYAAAMTFAVLDIFEGRHRTYGQYISLARSKAGPLFIFSVFDAIVGMALRIVAEKVPILGRVFLWVLGTLWSLGNMFTIPYIVTSETSAPSAVKQSMALFKSTWGENILTKASVNIPLFFIYLVLSLIFAIAIVPVMFAGTFLLNVMVILTFYTVIFFVFLVGSFANSLINVSLFYYATQHVVPPVFSEDLLNHVMIKRKRRFFRKVEPNS